METIRKGSKSIDVLSLQASLGLKMDGDFGEKTETGVKDFQDSHGLKIDGVVGPKTWEIILGETRKTGISEEAWEKASRSLGVEVAVLKAIHSVETSGASFLASGYPALLFEAHIFYKELKKRGKNPEVFLKSHPGIISRVWNRKLYKGGQDEVPRINEAFLLSPEASICSASFGAFQICGFNYGLCGYLSVYDFYKDIWSSEEGQLNILSGYLKGSGIVPYMKSKNFQEIARRYNGPGYKQNGYDTKLKAAYEHP